MLITETWIIHDARSTVSDVAWIASTGEAALSVFALGIPGAVMATNTFVSVGTGLAVSLVAGVAHALEAADLIDTRCVFRTTGQAIRTFINVTAASDWFAAETLRTNTRECSKKIQTF